MSWFFYVVLFLAVLALAYVVFSFTRIRAMKEGTKDMVELAGIIRSGADQFMRTEFTVIGIVVVVLAALFSVFIEKTSGITFLIGAVMSSLACIIGMKGATYANVRTANKALETKSIGETVQVALCGGSISGLSVQAFGIFGLVLILLIWGVEPGADGSGFVALDLGVNGSLMRITTYSLGCSVVAMFNRVAGGNYTKAADISADILGKIRNDLPEDDSRVPNV
ncbi:MAG: sodium/proton-translocating pyrophosphatase, partial [Lachnospiraceae bacterium]|nr:sodium/proton-translocating pyrophosphatase [Lachnospiraceae bacterium]